MLLYLLLPPVHITTAQSDVIGRSATFVAAVTCSLDTSVDGRLRHHLAIRGQTQEAHEVYEGGGEVQLPSKFTGGVVEGERVVVVVEAFAWKKKKNYNEYINKKQNNPKIPNPTEETVEEKY